MAPKRERLKEMNEILTEANKQLKLKQDELAQVQERVDDLQAQCDKTMEEKNRLVAEMERTRQRLLRAEKLRVGLADEHVRWISTVENIEKEAAKLIGDVFLSAACISYYGPFTGKYREELLALGDCSSRRRKTFQHRKPQLWSQPWASPCRSESGK